MSDLGPLPTLHDELVVFWIARVFAYSIHHEPFFSECRTASGLDTVQTVLVASLNRVCQNEVPEIGVRIMPIVILRRTGAFPSSFARARGKGMGNHIFHLTHIHSL